MKYLCLVYLDEKLLDAVPDHECKANGDALRASGHYVAAEALQGVHTATTVRVRNGRMSVTDHGPGLATEDVERIFEPFYRADPSRSRDSGGAGLGLSIVSAVVTAHGGRVKVSQTEGGGATFDVELPLATGL